MCKSSMSDYWSPGHSSKGHLIPFFRSSEQPKAPPGIPISYPENRVTNVSGRIRFAAATQSNGTGSTSEVSVAMPANRVQSEFAPGALNPKPVHSNTEEKDVYEMA